MINEVSWKSVRLSVCWKTGALGTLAAALPYGTIMCKVAPNSNIVCFVYHNQITNFHLFIYCVFAS